MTTRALHRAAIAAAITLSIGTTLKGGADLAAPVAQAQAPPTFRSATDLVQVDVIVHDKAGRFVADLTPDDFELREEGGPERIEFFDLMGEPSPATSSLQPAPAKPGPLSPAAPAAVPAWNAPGSPKLAPRTFVVVFDAAHLTPNGFKRVQAASVALFSKQFRAGDVGGVVVDGQMVNNRLTSDRDELLEALQKAKPNSRTNARLFDEREWPRMTEPEAVRIRLNDDKEIMRAVYAKACAEDPTACAKMDIESVIREKAARMAGAARVQSEQTLQSLAALFNGLGRLDGRKSVLLLTEGFIAEESWPLVERAVGLAARADARIYTLDARGLDRGDMANQLGGADPGAPDPFAQVLAQWDIGADSGNSLAVDTGGFVARNTNVFDRAIEQIARDAGTYYVLGYLPAKALDGTFRRISVKVNRPGVSVRARRGYLATPRPTVTPASAPVSAANAPGPVGSAPATSPAVAAAAAAPPPAAQPDVAVEPVLDTPPPAGAETTSTPPVPVASSSPATAGLTRMRPDAVKHAESLATSAPSDAAASKGWEAYQQGDLESAHDALESAAARPGARPWVHYALGQADYALRHFDRAVNGWEAVRSAAPEFEPVYFDLVDGYLQLKDYDRATRVLRAASDRWPGDSEVFSALGVVQVTRGTLDDAVKSFGQAVALAPQDGTAYFNLAKTYELRYRKSRRWVLQTRTWFANDHDRASAIDNYERAIKLGGSFEAAAREGLARLEWSEK